MSAAPERPALPAALAVLTQVPEDVCRALWHPPTRICEFTAGGFSVARYPSYAPAPKWRDGHDPLDARWVSGGGKYIRVPDHARRWRHKDMGEALEALVTAGLAPESWLDGAAHWWCVECGSRSRGAVGVLPGVARCACPDRHRPSPASFAHLLAVVSLGAVARRVEALVDVVQPGARAVWRVENANALRAHHEHQRHRAKVSGRGYAGATVPEVFSSEWVAAEHQMLDVSDRLGIDVSVPAFPNKPLDGVGDDVRRAWRAMREVYVSGAHLLDVADGFIVVGVTSPLHSRRNAGRFARGI